MSQLNEKFLKTEKNSEKKVLTVVPLPPDTAKIVKEFYMSEEISRIMPGMKDFVSIIEGGVKVHKQKHLVLRNLKEAFNHFNFKNVHPSIKFGFSKFAKLRSKECVLTPTRCAFVPFTRM